VVLVLSGRLVRNRLLVEPDGQWREGLWLEQLVAGAVAADAPSPPEKPVLTTPLPINSCSEDSLTLLPGVGPVLAGRIAEARRTGLVFATAADLRIVKGIGPALSARLDTLVIYFVPTPTDTIGKSR